MSILDFFLDMFRPKGPGDDPNKPPRGSKPEKEMSANGRRLLIELEGSEEFPYRDVAGLLTIGVGHLLTQDEISSGKIYINGIAVKYRNGLTREQIDGLLSQDLKRFEIVINKQVQVELTEGQFDALASFTFNVGGTAFQNSTLLKLLNQGRYGDVPSQLRRWVYAGGRKVRGLVNRREAEIELWNR